MNTDRRRILGPADAVRPTAALASSQNGPTIEDPRTEDHVRKFFVKTGLSKNANGLAYLEVGDTIVEVGIFGPRPIRGLFINRASFTVETKFLPYVTQPNEVLYNGTSGNPGAGRLLLTNIEQKISTYIETAFLPSIVLEKYPKSTIDVFINVLAFNSTTCSMLNLIAWTVNCTSLAMVDSGIEVRDLVTSGHAKIGKTASLVDGKNEQSVELDALITSDTDADVGTECVASFMAMQNNEMVAIWVQGNDASGVSEETLGLLLEGCNTMSTAVRKNINGYLVDMAKE